MMESNFKARMNVYGCEYAYVVAVGEGVSLGLFK
jgi:hypothetical protein